MTNEKETPVEVTQADIDVARGCYNRLAHIHSQVNCEWEHEKYLAPIFARHRLAATRPNIGDKHPLQMEPEERAKRDDRLRAAFSVQQKGVPDRSARQARFNLIDWWHELVRLRARLVRSSVSKGEVEQVLRDRLIEVIRAELMSLNYPISEYERTFADTILAAISPTKQGEAAAFQARVEPWLVACFGEMIAGDREERNHRFLEEALELVQSCGCSANEAHQLVDYVYGRPVGDPPQEVGGVMVTLAALCLANDLDMHVASETELARIWTKVEAIRAKQAAKPKHSPLPAALSPDLREENERLREELVATQTAHEKLIRSVLHAIDTGRSEPLFIVRDQLRNYLSPVGEG